jgi:hypothetical protein
MKPLHLFKEGVAHGNEQLEEIGETVQGNRGALVACANMKGKK